MADSQHRPRIDIEAVRLAAQWKSLFATELRLVAEELVTDGNIVTEDHYRQALPIAISKVLQAVAQEGDSVDVQRKVA